MAWELMLVAGVIALSTIATVTLIGEPRKPITPNMAGIVVLTNMVIIALVIRGGT